MHYFRIIARVIIAGCFIVTLGGCNTGTNQSSNSGVDVKPQKTKQASDHSTVGGTTTLPPAYLSVKNYKKCLSSEKRKTWSAWCLPKKRPRACPHKSWQQLKRQSITDCRN